MHLLLEIDLLKFSLCYLLVIQSSHNDRFTDLSLGKSLRSKKIFIPYSDKWSKLQSHIIVDSSLPLVDEVDASSSSNVSLVNLYKIASIFFCPHYH